MNTEELKKKLEETKAKIKANSKDAHFADALIIDLLRLHGMNDNPNMFPVLTNDNIEDSFDGGNYEINIFKDGTVMYHTRGGYTVIADYRITSLNEKLKEHVKHMKGISVIPNEHKEMIELDLSANMHVINIPMFAFSDVNLKFKLATEVIEYINNKYIEATTQPLADDDPELNNVFHDAVIGAYELKDIDKSAVDK